MAAVQLHDANLGIEGTAYRMSAAINDELQLPHLPDLPAREHMDYLYDSFRFHLCTNYHFLDTGAFQAQLDFHFQSPHWEALNQSPEYSQILMVIAFGKMLLGRQSTDFGPPGSEFCVAAIQHLPSLVQMHQTAIRSIEVLCLVSLYLQCAEMRNAAYLYVMDLRQPYGIFSNTARRSGLLSTLHYRLA